MTTNAELEALRLSDPEMLAFWQNMTEQQILTKIDPVNRSPFEESIDAEISALDTIISNPLPNDVGQTLTLAGIMRKLLLYHRKEIEKKY